MRAGALRDWVTFTRPADSGETTQDSYGQDVDNPSEIGNFRAQVEILSGTELAAVQEKWPEALYRITMRHQSGVTFTAKMIATWKGRDLDILHVSDPANTVRPVLIMFARDYAG